MEEIKVGEYVRTKDGIIAKVTYVDELMIDTDNEVFDLEDLCMMEIPIEYVDEYIVKHSPNIADILEEDDIGIMEYRGLIFRKFITSDDILSLKTKEYQLIKIVTHEQFKSIEYEVN